MLASSSSPASNRRAFYADAAKKLGGIEISFGILSAGQGGGQIGIQPQMSGKFEDQPGFITDKTV